MDVIEHRLKDRYGLKPSEDYEIVGIPTNLEGSERIRKTGNERQYIIQLGGQHGLIFTPSKESDNDCHPILWSLRDKKREDVRIIAEVKTGKPNSEQARPLQEYIENDTADIVILITFEPVTSEMREIANKIEKFKYKGLSFPRLQFWQMTDKFFDDPESVYDELQLPGKLRFKPTKKTNRLFPDIQFKSEMK